MLARILPPLVVAVLGLQTPPPDRDPAELERDVATLDRAARGRVTLSFRDAPLGEIIAAIGKEGGLETRGDWAMLELIGANPDDRIDFAASDSSPLGAMAALGIQISRDQDRPVVEALGGQVLLTLPLSLARLRGTATYEVEDLIAPTADPPGETNVAEPLTREERLESLKDLILEHVQPELWQDLGGEVGSMSVREGRLVISATPSMHLGVRQLLDGLREGLPGTAAVDLAVYRVPSAAIVELRKAAGDPHGLASEVARRFADRIVSAPRLVTRVGEPGSITVGSAGAATRSFSIEARRDAARGATVVDLDYSEEGPGVVAVRANPTLLVAGRRASDVIIVPSETAGGDATVLVVDVTLRGLERGSVR